MVPFTIRGYQPGDREQCRGLWRELTDWHREIYDDETIGGEHPENMFDEHLAEFGPERLWVAVRGSEVVGLVGLIVKGREAEVEPIIVSRAQRRRGVGKQLLSKAVSEARSLGVTVLSVKPVARNISALRFFYRRGFKNLGHVELFLDFMEREWKAGPRFFECSFNF